MAPGTRGISPPNLCPEETPLLGIYAMLIYILITFPRNAYHSTGFSNNSLVCVNVLQSLGVLRSSCSLLISVACIPVLPKPKGIIWESLILQPSQLFTKNQDLFWLCNASDHLKWYPPRYICCTHRYQWSLQIWLLCYIRLLSAAV